MAQAFPYTYYACDCCQADDTTTTTTAADDDDSTQHHDVTFDPRSPRANYALHPLEHLLYCEDCRQMRCGRCVAEETLAWYCPSCLFEVPSSVVKSDGPRCTRNCFNCPVCMAPLAVTTTTLVDATPDPPAAPARHMLSCPYCRWSTLETGIEFDKHTGVYAQISPIANGGGLLPTPKDRERHRADATRDDATIPAPSRELAFADLASFYQAQIDSQAPASALGDVNFASPSAYTRIMNLYSATAAKKHKRPRPAPMREAATALEGLRLHDAAVDAAAIERIKRDGWAATLSPTQKREQPDPAVQFAHELRPIPTLLRTRRTKRCRSCRQIVAKPESKITSTRYKIKILALSHLPRITIRALAPPSSTVQNPGAQPSPVSHASMISGVPTHFLLTLSNPLFDPIRVTLATSSTTPGRIQSRVTILCPQFEVGKNTDVWDDALSSSSPALVPERRGSLWNADGQIEAGKVWDKGRNWSSVAIEVVPGFLTSTADLGAPEPELDEDDDLLEIPIFVRLEYEADVNADERGLGDSRGSKGEKERREEAFWTVVGVGRIASL